MVRSKNAPTPTTVLLGAIFACATLVGCSSTQPGTTPASGDNLEFTFAQLDAALTPLDDVVNSSDPNEPEIESVRYPDPGGRLWSRCPDLKQDSTFHLYEFKNSTAALDDDVGRKVFLFPTEAVAEDVFSALAATPVGCDRHPGESHENLVTSVERSEFDGFDAITVRGVQVDTTFDDYWVRRNNVVIHVEIAGEATHADPLLRDALDTIGALDR